MSSRYVGKPFLKLLDSYVLSSIGKLDEATAQQLEAMEPDLRQTYGSKGDWRTIVAEQMRFPDELPGALMQIWTAGREKFVAAAGFEPDPLEFTTRLVDMKFPH